MKDNVSYRKFTKAEWKALSREEFDRAITKSAYYDGKQDPPHQSTNITHVNKSMTVGCETGKNA